MKKNIYDDNKIKFRDLIPKKIKSILITVGLILLFIALLAIAVKLGR